MNLAQFTRSLFARKPAGRTVRLQLEGLTDRVTPAVTASVANGVLTVKAIGDAADDSLTVAPVAGFAGRFTVTGTNSTVVNTVANGAFDAVGVRSMNFDLGEGADNLETNDLVLAGGISVRGGNGANVFRLSNSLIGGSVSVTNLTNASGTDFTNFDNSTVNGGVTVSNGLGSAGAQLNTSNILGSLKYTASSSVLIPGNDSIITAGLNVGGSVALTLANGNNSFVGNTVEVGGGFAYTGGGGTDSLSFLNRAIIGASATVKLGEDANSIGISGVAGAIVLFVGARLTVTAGAGADTVSLGSDTNSRVNGAAAFNLGNGGNTFTTTGLRAGSLSLTTGIGADTGTFNNLTVVGAAALNFGAGANTVNLASTAASSGPSVIGGALTVTAGAGADTIKVGSNNTVRVGGAARFTLGTAAAGNGDNSLQINNSLFGSSLGIIGGSGIDTMLLGTLASVGVAGRLTVSANAGNDRLDLGVAGDANKVVRLLAVPALNGGAGSDVLFMFGAGNVQGPPGVVVHPTGPALVAAGWEGIG